jgi:outer membrane protein OmpA-like peptidoglycan-associated protein
MPHKVRFSIGLCLAASVLAVTPMHASAIEGSWQLGINAGISRLTPDANDSDFTLEDDQSTSLNVYASLDLTPIFSVELAFTDLGEATLSDNETISYQAFSIGTTAYLFGEKEAAYRSDGVSGYVRLGLNAMVNESDVLLSEADNTAIWLAAGMQFPFADNWGIRAELASYDGDAQALMAGIYWRSGERFPSRAAPSLTIEPAVIESSTETPEPTQESPAAPRQEQPEVSLPDENSQVAQTRSACPSEQLENFDNPSDCELLNSQLVDLEFANGSADIIPGTTSTLDAVADFLLRNPRKNLEIQAHVSSSGNNQSDVELSAMRARSVAKYLVDKGVFITQLRAKSFGASQSIIGDGSILSNDRIVLRSL